MSISQHLDKYSECIAKRHAAFEHFRDATIKKWNEKTRLASGKVNNKVRMWSFCFQRTTAEYWISKGSLARTFKRNFRTLF